MIIITTFKYLTHTCIRIATSKSLNKTQRPPKKYIILLFHLCKQCVFTTQLCGPPFKVLHVFLSFSQGRIWPGEDDHSAPEALLYHREPRGPRQGEQGGGRQEWSDPAALRRPGHPPGPAALPALPGRGAQTGRSPTQGELLIDLGLLLNVG